MLGLLRTRKVIRVVDTILLVDGEPGRREALKFLLELQGYRVAEAHHGIEGLQVLCEWGADIQLALCAPDLPDMTGGEWMGQMRFLGPEIPALVLTEREALEALVREQMGNAYPLDVPLEVSVGAGQNWSAADH